MWADKHYIPMFHSWRVLQVNVLGEQAEAHLAEALRYKPQGCGFPILMVLLEVLLT
jgi:hypothetical protein